MHFENFETLNRSDPLSQLLLLCLKKNYNMKIKKEMYKTSRKTYENYTDPKAHPLDPDSNC